MKRSSRAQPASSAVAALSIEEAPAPITATRLPRSASKSMASAVCAQNRRSMVVGDRRHVRPAEPIAPRRQDDMTRKDQCAQPLPWRCASASSPSRRGSMALTSMPFSTGSSSTLPVPDEIVHPQRARRTVEGVPGFGTEARLVIGPERQGRQSHRRPGELLRRAQGAHPRIGDPRPLGPGRGAVEQHMVVDAEPLEHARGDEARHAGADDDDVAHALALDLARRHPGLGRQLQPGEILCQPLLQGVESGRHGAVGFHSDASS